MCRAHRNHLRLLAKIPGRIDNKKWEFELVLGRVSDQTLLLVEGDVRGSGEATLLVGNDLDIVTLVGSNARVGSTCGS